jgi:endoglucanase
LEADIASIRGNFTDVPIVIGETQAGTLLETAARRKYFDFLGRTATKYNTSVIVWDNGDAYLDRATGVWREPELIDILQRAIKGESNSLSDSTTDIEASSQNSSAYIWHKIGNEVTDQTVSFLLNGNTVNVGLYI